MFGISLPKYHSVFQSKNVFNFLLAMQFFHHQDIFQVVMKGAAWIKVATAAKFNQNALIYYNIPFMSDSWLHMQKYRIFNEW